MSLDSSLALLTKLWGGALSHSCWQRGDVYERVLSEAHSLGLSDQITWLHYVDDIRELYDIADVLLLCSDREALGRCVVEAMSLEVPVVITDSGGTHELIGANDRGIVVRSGDARGLADALVATLQQPGMSVERTARARQFVEAELDARRSAQAVMRIYDQVLRPLSREDGLA